MVGYAVTTDVAGTSFGLVTAIARHVGVARVFCDFNSSCCRVLVVRSVALATAETISGSVTGVFGRHRNALRMHMLITVIVASVPGATHEGHKLVLELIYYICTTVLQYL